jgi:hypothetical protein
MLPVTFFPMSDIVVVGQNDECADYDNPRGELFGMAVFICAEDKDGNRVRLHVGTETFRDKVHADAEKLTMALLARLANGKLPVAFDRWVPTFPAYGSAAYSNEDAVAWERSLEEFV